MLNGLMQQRYGKGYRKPIILMENWRYQFGTLKRIPKMFELTKDEIKNLRSQIVTSSWGGARYLSTIFPEKESLMKKGLMIPDRRIEKKILLIRGQKVIIDADLAELYGVTTGNLNKAVKRNIERFPNDFMFQLTSEEYKSLRFQFGILEKGQHSKYLPYAFTEQGVAMLSSVLRSKRAIEVNIAIMRAFVQLRKTLDSHAELARKLSDLEKRFESHDEQIQAIFEAIRQLMAPPDKPKKKIGYTVREKQKTYANKMKN